MIRMLIDGPANGTIHDWNDGYYPMKVPVMEALTSEIKKGSTVEVSILTATYWPVDIFDPGDEKTLRPPSMKFLMIWENSPRAREYRGW